MDINSFSYRQKKWLVLVAEDEPISQRIIAKNLSDWGYEPIVVSDGRKALSVFRQQRIPIVLLDWMMPGLSGPELARQIREIDQKKRKYTYIILVTSRDKIQDISAGFAAGVDDYITKPFHPLELKSRLQAGMRIISLERQLLNYQKKLEKLATTDSLLRIKTRRQILAELNSELARAEREQQNVGLILVDIDHFKKINDTYGHPAGDKVLKKIARQLKKNIRQYDQIGRYGGDELIIILPNCGLSEVSSISQRLCQSVAKLKIPLENKITIQPTLSGGATSSEAFTRASPQSLINACDKALYQAKARGRNQIVTYPQKQTIARSI
jgi:diguanylate cyclase (GGDEF)-like protein